MKKSFLLIAIMFLMFFINKAVVNAETGYIYVNAFNNGNQETGNLNPNWINMGTNSQQIPNINVGAVDSEHNTNPTFKSGDRFQVVAKWCVSYSSGNYTLSQTSTGLKLNVNNYSISKETTSCAFTASDGTVSIGQAVITTVFDFTFLDGSSLNPNVKFQLQRVNPVTSSLVGFSIGFLNYSILTGSDIIETQNAQDIINAANANTQSIIDNNNRNAQNIINAQNGTTNAVNANTDAVNGLNNSVNNTDTSGSENALSSIINDPAFQDNTGINSIITLPVNMISSLSNTCYPITINIPFINSNVQLPCFRAVITQHMPLVANLIGIVVNGFILYRILIDIVGIVKSARNPDEDRLDVLEL